MELFGGVHLKLGGSGATHDDDDDEILFYFFFWSGNDNILRSFTTWTLYFYSLTSIP